jgi:hypothetical protein
MKQIAEKLRGKMQVTKEVQTRGKIQGQDLPSQSQVVSEKPEAQPTHQDNAAWK